MITRYGIKTPKKPYRDSYIWWVAEDSHSAWMSFFTYPNQDGDRNPHRLPIAEAVEAYKAIGYKCVRIKLEEI